jgi:putative MATE family efflux protein
LEEKITKDNPMGYGNILKLLITMSLPAMFSMFIQSLYNIVDSYFVAKISEKALRATSMSYPVQIFIIAFGVGTGVGVNSYVARRLGANKQEDANKGAMHGIILAILTWFIFLIFRFVFLSDFFNLFTQDAEVKAMGIQYLEVITFFSIFSLIQITIEKTIQGTGHMIIPMMSQLVGAIINIILDPILIFGLFGFPSMGIRGAAIATIIGQGIGACIGISYIVSSKSRIKLKFKEFKFSLDIVKCIYQAGLPSILIQSIGAILTTILNQIIIQYSEMAVSVLGIYYKLESFIFMPVFGLGQGVLPLIGYNYGAQKKERIKETYKYGVIIASIIMTIGMLIFQLFPRELLRIFAEDDEMIKMGIPALRIISLSYIPAAIGIINSIYFQSLGIGKYSLLISALRQCAIIIPVAYIMSIFSLELVWTSYPIAEVIAVFISIYLYKRISEKYIDILPN